MTEARPLISTSLETHGLAPGCDGVFPSLCNWGDDLTIDRVPATLTVVIPDVSGRATKADVFYCAIWVGSGVRSQESS